MAMKKGVVVAVAGTVAAPVPGYFIYKKVAGSGEGSAAQIPGLEVLNLNRNDGKAFEIKEGCIKTKFSELGAIKDSIDNSTPSVQKQDSEKKTLGEHSTGTVDGCLMVDVKWRSTTEKQHAIWAKLEMTLTKGSHGLIFRTMITNLLDEGTNSSFQALNQAYKLTKQNNTQWKIDHGYLWTDEVSKNLSDTLNNEKTILDLSGLVTAKVSYWDLCTMTATPGAGTGDKKCDKLDASSFQTASSQKKTWGTAATETKGIFEHLTIKGGKENDEKLGTMWGQKSEDLFKNDLDGGRGNKYLYEEDKGFVLIKYESDDNKAKENLTKWFEPFKTEKGAWS